VNAFFMFCTICTLSQYRPGKMAEVLENRDMNHVADGYLAVRDCQFIGQTVWLRSIGDQDWERFVVADCARPPGTDGAYEWMTNNHIVGEVDHNTAKRWDRVGIAAKAQVKTHETAKMPIMER